MRNKRQIISHIIRTAIATVILTVAVGYARPVTAVEEKDDFRCHPDSLKCVITLSGRLGSTEGKGVGLSYEMLECFADYVNTNIEIVQGDISCLDSLVAGKVDIVVVAHAEECVADTLCDDLIASKPIRGSIEWVARRREDDLMRSVNIWLTDFMESRLYRRISTRYYRSYREVTAGAENFSPYDDILEQYGQKTGIDWMLLAALVYQESQFYVAAESKNAKGLMQVADATAARYGVTDLFNPEMNIKAGSLHLKYLLDMYRQQGLDSLNVVKFALASYNAGHGQIDNCRTHALSEGKNPNDWEEVVSTFETNESLIGKTTTEYVNNILERYDSYVTASAK